MKTVQKRSLAMSQQWQERARPARLERRYQFSDYSSLSDFLERAAALSEREGLYPDMGFGRDYVNMTIHGADDDNTLGDQQRRLARELDALATQKAG
jgi:4a-hydroxytetrahydrobiopterin dehydratase